MEHLNQERSQLMKVKISREIIYGSKNSNSSLRVHSFEKSSKGIAKGLVHVLTHQNLTIKRKKEMSGVKRVHVMELVLQP